MIVEFQGDCSLEIAHVGTRDEIEALIFLTRCFRISSADLIGRRLVKTIEQIDEAAAEAGRQLAEFLKTAKGIELIEKCGVGRNEIDTNSTSGAASCSAMHRND
jgi:hypothetical protein